jgi:diacylglycerol kinase (ATP)
MFKSTLKNVPGRIVRALRFSGQGLKSAFLKEEAFRLEVLGLGLLAAALAALTWPWWKKVVLVAAYMLIPLAELLNSALEDICDLISPDYQPLIAQAKDKGSAAVLLAIVINILVLSALLLAD